MPTTLRVRLAVTPLSLGAGNGPMNAPDPGRSRLETVLGAVLYLMTAYQRTRCPRIAACIAAHLECLAAHPHADAVIREVCAGMHEEWRCAAGAGPLARRSLH